MAEVVLVNTNLAHVTHFVIACWPEREDSRCFFHSWEGIEYCDDG